MRLRQSLAAFALLAVAAAAATAEVSPQNLLIAGHLDEAIAALLRQISSSPNDAEANHWLGRAYHSEQDWDHAIQYGEKAVALAPTKSGYYLWLARSYGEKADSSGMLSAPGWARKARVAWEKAVELDGSNVEARGDLAEFYFEAPGFVGGGKDKARAQADALMKLNPVKSHWVYARIAEKNSDSATAEREYRAALAASNNGAQGWLYMAAFYRNGKRWSEMEDAVQKLGAAADGSSDTWLDGASLLLRAGRNFPLAVDLAKRCLAPEKSTEESPAFKAHTLLGQLYEKTDDKKAAADEYRAALVLAKNFKPALEGLRRVTR